MYLESKEKFVGVEAPADPFSVESLIVWLKRQPAHQKYCAGDPGICLIAQYVLDAGGRITRPEGYFIGDHNLGVTPTYHGSDHPFFHVAYGADGRTFGAALSRALAIKEGK